LKHPFPSIWAWSGRANAFLTSPKVIVFTNIISGEFVIELLDKGPFSSNLVSLTIGIPSLEEGIIKSSKLPCLISLGKQFSKGD
jgi:hypothetical protein